MHAPFLRVDTLGGCSLLQGLWIILSQDFLKRDAAVESKCVFFLSRFEHFEAECDPIELSL